MQPAERRTADPGDARKILPGAKDAWAYSLDALGRYYDRVATLIADGQTPPAGPGPLAKLMQQDLPAAVSELVGTYLDSARMLGERTAALHLALASEPGNKAFAPEPFTPHFVRGLFQSMRNQASQNFGLLRQRLKTLPPEAVPLAGRVLELEPAIINRFRLLYERRINARRIRCHGDFHLGQVLYTGKDFVIIDFEGEPALPLSERRIKRSPLRDVAGMVRSFDYAAWAGLDEHIKRGSLEPERRHKFEPWQRLWQRAVGAVYLRAYRQTMGQTDVLPHSDEELLAMLPAYLLNKAVYEVGYELNNRPGWLIIPLAGILQLLEVEQ